MPGDHYLLVEPKPGPNWLLSHDESIKVETMREKSESSAGISHARCGIMAEALRDDGDGLIVKEEGRSRCFGMAIMHNS